MTTTDIGFIESEERQALRKSVAAMAANYGQDYYLEKARSGQHTDELWQETGKLGFIGVNLPEEYGGGGAGMYELSIVMAGETTISSSGQPPADISSITIDNSYMPAPPPPYSSGRLTPMKPSLPVSCHNSSVCWPARAFSK